MPKSAYTPERYGIMLAYPLEEKRFAKWGFPCYVQPKLDGERCRMLYDHFLGSWQFFAAGGDCCNFAVPHLVKQANASSIPRFLHLDGELYCHSLSQQQIHSIASRRTNLHEDHEVLSFSCFDSINDFPQYMRLSTVELRAFPFFPEDFRYVRPELIDSAEQFWNFLDRCILGGYEGAIAREHSGLYKPLDPSEKAKRSTSMMKFKPRERDYYPIVNLEEQHDKHGTPKDTLGKFICETDGRTFGVGTGWDHAFGKKVWEEFKRNPEPFRNKSLSLLIKYQHLTGTKGHEQGVPRSAVYADIVPSEEVEE